MVYVIKMKSYNMVQFLRLGDADQGYVSSRKCLLRVSYIFNLLYKYCIYLSVTLEFFLSGLSERRLNYNFL